MQSHIGTFALALATFGGVAQAMYESPHNLPAKTDAAHGQKYFNDCRSRWGDSSHGALCQNLYVNSIQDFCLWGPAVKMSIPDAEREAVSYCTKSGYGTRVIPAGTITGAQFIKTPHYIQLSVVGDFTKLGTIEKGDDGTEFDYAGADGAGNPIGSLVYSRAFSPKKDTLERVTQWHQFASAYEYCFRGCDPHKSTQEGDLYCPHIYDEMGCSFNDPGRYDPGHFEQCDGEDGEPTGIYNGRRWYQGQKPEPKPHPAAKTSNCRVTTGIKGGQAIVKPGSRRRDFDDADILAEEE